MNNSIPIDVVTLFQPEYLAFPGLRQKLALLVAKSIPRHRPQVTRTRWVWPASERLNPLTRRDYVKTHVWVFWKNQPIPERILLFMPWFLQITNKWLIKHVEKLHAFWIKCFPTKIMCFNRKIPCLPTVADKQGIRLKMHEMAILETLILKKFWGGGWALVQTHMTSILGSQTWGLCPGQVKQLGYGKPWPPLPPAFRLVKKTSLKQLCCEQNKTDISHWSTIEEFSAKIT